VALGRGSQGKAGLWLCVQRASVPLITAVWRGFLKRLPKLREGVGARRRADRLLLCRKGRLEESKFRASVGKSFEELRRLEIGKIISD